MHRLTIILLAVGVSLGSGAVDAGGQTTNLTSGPSVWTVDLVRTLPGQQSAYVSSIEANWNSARSIAINRGAVLSYRALMASPDMSRGWDVMLMTEYADSTAWEDRERIFEEIFSSSEFVRTPTATPSSEMREFVDGSVVMKEFVRGNP
jgi:hypothetical protein